MNLSADALLFLASKGMSVEDIAEFVRLTEKRKDPTAAERMARYRARKNKGESVTRNVTANPPIERIHTPRPDISSDEESQSDERDDCEIVVANWNSMASAHGLPTCAKLSPARRRACRARLRDDGLGAIQRAIQHIPKSSFLLGQSGNWSGANINFLLRPDTVTKILEGQYDDRTKNLRSSVNGSPDRRSSLARAIDEGEQHLEWLAGN